MLMLAVISSAVSMTAAFGPLPVPSTPMQFEADVTIKETSKIIPFPLPAISGHMYYDYKNKRQRLDTTALGITQSNVDFYAENKTIAYYTMFGKTVCNTCYLQPPMYPLVVLPGSIKVGTEVVNGVTCTDYRNPFLSNLGLDMTICVEETHNSVVKANLTVGVGPLYPEFMKTEFIYTFKNFKPTTYEPSDPLFKIPKECPVHATCAAKLNVVFLLDGSGSIKGSDWSKTLSFVSEMVDRFTMSDTAVNAAVIQFSSSAKVECAMAESQDSLKKCVAGIRQMQGGTATSAGIDAATKLFNGLSRQGSNILITVTDGQHNIGPAPESAARNCESSAHADLYAIGVGSDIDVPELKSICSPPIDSHFFTVDNFDALNKIMDEVARNSCGSDGVCNPNPNQGLEFMNDLEA